MDNQAIGALLGQFIAECKQLGFCSDADFNVNDPAVIQFAEKYSFFINTYNPSCNCIQPLRSALWNFCNWAVSMHKRM